ncbi:hypothetical protein DFH07DRAFT_689522, partial [Mycena maculata]
PLPAPLAPSPPHLVAPAASSSPTIDSIGMARSIAELEARSHAIRQTIAAEEQSDKETGTTYARQVKNYQQWWEASEALRKNENPSYTIVPAFPIIASKAVFLEYETTR